MKRPNSDDLELGPDVLQHLLPHRRPFLMVDRMILWAREPRPKLTAERLVSANEPVFSGHFPGWHVWPGVYTLEGLGQSCNLLCVLEALAERTLARGEPIENVREALRNLQRGYRLDPGFRPELVSVLRNERRDPGELIGFAASAEIKWLAPVLAGDRLVYHVEQSYRVDDMLRFDVEARVEDRAVARGRLMSKVGLPFPLIGLEA